MHWLLCTTRGQSTRCGICRGVFGHGPRANCDGQSSRSRPGALLEQARVSGLTAIDLDAGIGDAHLALAESPDARVELACGRGAYRTAIALSPSCESAHRSYGVFLAAMSRTGEAKTETDGACDLDPSALSSAPARHG